MADDEPGATDDDPRGGEPVRVARERYVRSGWGVLFLVGLVAGIVVVITGAADFDTEPFCTTARDAAASTTTITPGAPVTSQQAADLAAAEARLAAYRALDGTLPYSLTDELEMVTEREERLVAALEDLPADATPEQLSAAVVAADGSQGREIADAVFAIDIYAAEHCELGPDLVD